MLFSRLEYDRYLHPLQPSEPKLLLYGGRRIRVMLCFENARTTDNLFRFTVRSSSGASGSVTARITDKF